MSATQLSKTSPTLQLLAACTERFDQIPALGTLGPDPWLAYRGGPTSLPIPGFEPNQASELASLAEAPHG